VGLFFGTVLTSLTAFLQTTGDGESAGLVYGVMGVGSTILALCMALFPQRFRLWARWLTFSSLMLAAMIAFALASGLPGVITAMALAGIGVGPTVVTVFSLAAERSPRGRSSTVMTMVGSGTIVGQSAASALTGAVAESGSVQAAMWLPAVAAALVVLAALVNALACRRATHLPLDEGGGGDADADADTDTVSDVDAEPDPDAGPDPDADPDADGTETPVPGAVRALAQLPAEHL